MKQLIACLQMVMCHSHTTSGMISMDSDTGNKFDSDLSCYRETHKEVQGIYSQ